MFSERFINILRTDRGPRSSMDLAALWTAAQPEIPAAGPCTLYIGASAVLSADLDLLDRFTVVFGPGAKVTVAAGVAWTIRGSVDLGSEARFVMASGARVSLLGPLERILPEWWDPSVDADAALARAFELAAQRIVEEAPQAPVELVGPYHLRRPLDLRSPTNGEVEYVVHGRHPRGDAALRPTLAYASPSNADFPLVTLREGVRLLARRVAFDATSRREPSKRRSRVPPAIEIPERSSGTTLERCTFFVEHGGAIGVGASAVSTAAAPSVEHRRLSLRECWFESFAANPANVSMIAVAPGARVRLGVDGCTLRGAARAMVTMASGVCEVIGSDFENRSAANADPGVDFELGGAPGASSDTEGLMFSEIHTRSYSFRHLTGESASIASWSSTICLTGVVHAPRYGDLAANLRPPAVTWSGFLENEILVQGCDIAGTLLAPRPNRVALLATTLRGSPRVSPDDGREIGRAHV